MRIRVVKKHLQVVCVLVMGLLVEQVFAGWSDAGPQGYYKPRKYGDFPPLDIDEQLQQSMNYQEELIKQKYSGISQPRDESAKPAGSIPQSKTAIPPQPLMPYQQPAADISDAGDAEEIDADAADDDDKLANDGTKKKKKKKKKKKNNSGFGFPWGNNNSGFKFPWSNSGSGFPAPWNNRRSSYDRPWDNRNPWNNSRSGFNPPWDKDNDNFDFPWGDNNGFSFGPWGNDRRHRH